MGSGAAEFTLDRADNELTAPPNWRRGRKKLRLGFAEASDQLAWNRLRACAHNESAMRRFDLGAD